MTAWNPNQPVAAAAAKEFSVSPLIQSFVAGGIAGGVSRTAVAPLERLKIMYQVQHSRAPGIVSALRRIYAVEGVRGLFKGNGANCLRIVPNSAVKFFAYEQLSKAILNFKRRTDGPNAELTPWTRLWAGACAGILAMSSVYPVEMVRGRLSVQAESGGAAKYRGIWHGIVCISREEGVRALFRGWLPSVIGVIPYVGLNFSVYETCKAGIIRSRGLSSERDIEVWLRLACGGFAGSVGQTVAYPLDVVRRRMQVEGWQGNTAETKILSTSASSGGGPAAGVGKQQVAYKGMWDAFVRTVKEEGVLSLYRGIGTNIIKVGPSIAIAFVTYEQLKEILDVRPGVGAG
mmetsp:Transcript_6624/g.24593  ORF Transcript_6624/g.24593 Transcript_6624/m.24593 type:complete len:346 (+) Transcript_6624:353-1390(+)